ncbi:MAG: hypothetical protein AAFO89_14445, partial [Planctomycetota bacterium]
MTRTSRFTTAVAAGLLAVAGLAGGLALPAAAQQSTTTTSSISINNGEIEGEIIKIVDGTEYVVEFNEDDVLGVFVDGDEAGYTMFDDTVTIKHGGETIEIQIPQVGGQADGRIIGIARGDLPRLGLGDGVAEARDFGQDFAWSQPRAKTMVGLTQSGLEDQLREHLDLDEGVGTMILSTSAPVTSRPSTAMSTSP